MRAAFRKVTILLLLSGGAAHAAEWKIEPALEFEAGYNDNVRLNVDDELSSAEATLSPSSKFSVETPRSGLSGALRFDFSRFEEDSNLDENNVRFNMNSFHRLESSQVIGLDAAIVKDTTLDSQLEDTGLVLGRLRRLRLSGGPNWTYNLNERTQARFSFNYSDVQYKNAGNSGFVDYTIKNADITLRRILNERTTTSLTLSQSRTDNDNSVESTNSNLQGGASHQFSETLSASLFAGVRYTETDFSQNTLVPIFSGDIIIGFIPLTQDVSNSSTGYTFSTSLTKKFLRGESGLTASRDISNSTNGIPIQVTRLGWNNRYRFTELLSASLKLDFYNSETENSATSNLNRDYYQIRPSVSWNLKRSLLLSGSYLYRKQTFDNTGDDATQNAAYLTLRYQWPRIAVSR